jgi:phosphate transport system ATP-binding protein
MTCIDMGTVANATMAGSIEGASTILDHAITHIQHGATGNVLDIEGFSLWYGGKQALYDISMSVQQGLVTSLIGPSGCGKSTLLRSLNRMNDLIPGLTTSGKIRLKGDDTTGRDMDVIQLRKRLGMVFQKPNPFPKSIFENIAYGLRVNGWKDEELIASRVRRCLRQAALWDEVQDRLSQSALSLSGGQQQRLCIARALAVEPEVLLMDEPCSALDPIATAKIEDLLDTLRGQLTIIIVTHNMQQAEGELGVPLPVDLQAEIGDVRSLMYISSSHPSSP